MVGQWQSGEVANAREEGTSAKSTNFRLLAEVKAAAGHASLLTTSVYLRVAVEDEGKVGDLFCFAK